MTKSINPATGEVLQEYTEYSDQSIDEILRNLQQAQSHWRHRPIKDRATLIENVGKILLSNKESLGRICTLEMGKLYSEAISEIEKCALGCSYYAENGESFLANEMIKTEGQTSFVTFQPLGVILGIMPWNFPFWQVIRFAAPTLLAGNGVILKHASNVSGCALALEDIFKEAGLPENLFRTIIVSSKNMSNIIANPVIKAVSLTGSTQAGKSVATAAGSVLKKAVLELGGSDAYLVLKDADLPMAAKTLVKGRLLNAGQSCISPKRLVVDQQVHDEFRFSRKRNS